MALKRHTQYEMLRSTDLYAIYQPQDIQFLALKLSKLDLTLLFGDVAKDDLDEPTKSLDLFLIYGRQMPAGTALSVIHVKLWCAHLRDYPSQLNEGDLDRIADIEARAVGAITGEDVRKHLLLQALGQSVLSGLPCAN